MLRLGVQFSWEGVVDCKQNSVDSAQLSSEATTPASRAPCIRHIVKS